MKRFISKITSKHLFWFGVGAVVCAIIIGLLAVPPRGISWQYENTIPSIGDFFSNLFSPQPIAILILGYPGEQYNGGDLTDSILVAHFNPNTSKVYLVSIPRDLWISDNTEQFKINEALRKKKVDLLIEKAEAITGFSIDGYVMIDLAFTQKVIDALGGIDVVLQQPAVDWVSGYTMEAGPHHLNGEDAVWLIRNRFNPQGDFFREENQQQIIDAALKKFTALSREQKINFLQQFVIGPKLLEHVNVGITRLMPYILESDKLKNIQLKNIVLDFTTKLFMSSSVPIQGPTSTIYASVLLPAEGFEKYGAIQKYIQEKIKN